MIKLIYDPKGKEFWIIKDKLESYDRKINRVSKINAPDDIIIVVYV